MEILWYDSSEKTFTAITDIKEGLDYREPSKKDEHACSNIRTVLGGGQLSRPVPSGISYDVVYGIWKYAICICFEF